MYLIDTHTHIYLPEFDDDLSEIMERAGRKGIGDLLLPAIDRSTHEKMLLVEGQFKACKAMMGLHPCSVKEDWETELKVVRQYLDQRRFIAIGEIGLDFYWDKTYTDQQYNAFHRQLGWALEMGLPVSIHSRNATEECIGVVQQYKGLTGVFHCFSGTAEQAGKVMQAGLYLGIGGVLTFKNAGLDTVIAQVGLEKVVLETDAPYLAPVPFRGKRNEPAYTVLIAEKLAGLFNREVGEIAEITTENARQLFKL
ncbi:MAG TPA: TatD family hydrolase [Flavisolibacter sp.]|jgi:TatD DNase family protein|nr:TatD family hydrolase [Flavisolibacter sp.]